MIEVLREWQSEAGLWQLHPGDLGWFQHFGAEATAAAVRVWRRADQVLAIGLLDGDHLLRMTITPDARQDEALARDLLRDIADPERGVLPSGPVSVEAPARALAQTHRRSR